jgi:YHS domain-containing protein
VLAWVIIFKFRDLILPLEGGEMEKDRVYGASIDEKKSEITYYFQGDTFYFCSSECRDKFVEATVSWINP